MPRGTDSFDFDRKFAFGTIRCHAAQFIDEDRLLHMCTKAPEEPFDEMADAPRAMVCQDNLAIGSGSAMNRRFRQLDAEF